MSEDDQITLIVAHTHCNLMSWDLSRMLGYHPDRLELRFFPDETDEILREHYIARRCKESKIYLKWSKDWDACTGQERVEQKRMLEARMAIVERKLQEAERREIEAGKLRRHSAKFSREYRSETAERVKKKKVLEAMALDRKLDFKLYEQNAELYEQTVLNAGQAAAEEETTTKKNRLFEMVSKKGHSTKPRRGLATAQWKPTVDDSASEVTTLCEKDDDFKTTD